MFYKIGVLKNFPKFTSKLFNWSLFFDKVAGLFRNTPRLTAPDADINGFYGYKQMKL